MERKQYIKIKVKQNQGSAFNLTVDKNSSVLQLKQLCEQETSIPVISQKIIFQGKLLKDVYNLNSLGFDEGMFCHMVVGSSQNRENETIKQIVSDNQTLKLVQNTGATAQQRRVIKEFQDCQSYLDQCNSKIELFEQDNYFKQKLTMTGPQGSPYEGGKFQVQIKLPQNYPFKSPEFQFKTKIYHPYIKTETGEIYPLTPECNWSPAKKIIDEIKKITLLMSDPLIYAPYAPLEPIIYKECEGDVHDFEQKAKEFTKKYAMGN